MRILFKNLQRLGNYLMNQG